jgi:hypothetical protein
MFWQIYVHGCWLQAAKGAKAAEKSMSAEQENDLYELYDKLWADGVPIEAHPWTLPTGKANYTTYSDGGAVCQVLHATRAYYLVKSADRQGCMLTAVALHKASKSRSSRTCRNKKCRAPDL